RDAGSGATSAVGTSTGGGGTGGTGAGGASVGGAGGAGGEDAGNWGCAGDVCGGGGPEGGQGPVAIYEGAPGPLPACTSDYPSVAAQGGFGIDAANATCGAC